MSHEEVTLGVIGQALVDLIYSVEPTEPQKFGLALDSHQHISAQRSQEIQTALQPLTPHLVSGGSAINTLVAYQLLGGKSTVFFRSGADPYATIFRQELETLGSDLHVVTDPTLPTGHSLILSAPPHGRAMATCLGAANVFHHHEVNPKFFRASDALLLEGYMLLIEGNELLTSYAQSFQEGKLTIFALSAPWIPSRVEEKVRAALSLSSIVVANEKEAAGLTQIHDPKENVRTLARLLPPQAKNPLVVITVGAEGAFIGDSTRVTHVPAVPTTVADVTGAGDAFIGGFLFSLLRKRDPVEAARHAALLASGVVAQMGARVTPVLAAQVLSQFKSAR